MIFGSDNTNALNLDKNLIHSEIILSVKECDLTAALCVVYTKNVAKEQECR